MVPIVLSGYGVKVATVDGVLVLEHGDPGEREIVRVARSQRPRPNLVVTGRTGYITLAAIRWLEGVGTTLTVLDEDGAPLLVGAAGSWLNGTLRRRQVLGDGIVVGRYLIGRKLEAQASVLRKLPEPPRKRREGLRGAPAWEKVEAYRERVRSVETLSELQYVESLAGRAYWLRVAAAPMVWRDDVPEHWRTVGRRHRLRPHSLHGTHGYGASTPGQALINYGYGYLLAMAVQACYSVGLDPAIGHLHRRAQLEVRGGQRAEFAMDLMEPVRPVVDHQVLQLLASRTFTRRDDAREAPNGGVLLRHTLRRSLILSCADPVTKGISEATSDVVRLLRKRSDRTRISAFPFHE